MKQKKIHGLEWEFQVKETHPLLASPVCTGQARGRGGDKHIKGGSQDGLRPFLLGQPALVPQECPIVCLPSKTKLWQSCNTGPPFQSFAVLSQNWGNYTLLDMLNAIFISMWSHLRGKKIQRNRVVFPIRVGFLCFEPVKTRELEFELDLLLNIYHVLKWSIPCHISKQGCHNRQWFHVNFWAQGYPEQCLLSDSHSHSSLFLGAGSRNENTGSSHPSLPTANQGMWKIKLKYAGPHGWDSYERNDFSKPTPLYLTIHGKTINSLIWGI